MAGKDGTSPSMWRMRMLKANAVARAFGKETLDRAVFDGPVFKNKKKTDPNIKIHADGNGVKSIPMKKGNAQIIPQPDTRKYEPGYFLRNRSAAQPPASVDVNPATAMIMPNISVEDVSRPRSFK